MTEMGSCFCFCHKIRDNGPSYTQTHKHTQEQVNTQVIVCSNFEIRVFD